MKKVKNKPSKSSCPLENQLPASSSFTKKLICKPFMHEKCPKTPCLIIFADEYFEKLRFFRKVFEREMLIRKEITLFF